jgi:hypothetical protein
MHRIRPLRKFSCLKEEQMAKLDYNYVNMAFDLAKTAVSSAGGGTSALNNPQEVADLIEVVATKLQQLYGPNQ